SEGFISAEDMNLIQIIDEPDQIVNAIFKYYESSGFEPTAAEREIQLNI
ncbi:MAG: TIGR00730 family Rossman fold protein, partial [Nitrosomonas sp.]